MLEGEPDNQSRSFKEASKATDAATQLVDDEDNLRGNTPRLRSTATRLKQMR